MLERVFGDVRLEELARSFYCASVNLRGNSLVIDRDGPMVEAVGASMSLPLIGPPMRREREPADRRLAARQPAAGADELAAARDPCWRSTSRAARSARRRTETRSPGIARGEQPSPATVPCACLRCRETMARVALLSSANTDESARRYADMTIRVRVSGVGLLEFHQIDEARAAGTAGRAGGARGCARVAAARSGEAG